MTLIMTFGQATQSSRVLERDIECQLYINGNYPKVGEIFEVIFRVRLKSDQDLKHLPAEAIAQGYIVHFGGSRPKDAVEVLNNNEIFVPVMHLGEWREFVGKFCIIKPAPQVSFGAGIHLKVCAGSGTGRSRTIYLIDSATGQYGTREEYERRLPVEYRYDPLVGTFTCSPSQNPAPIEENRGIIKMIKELEPSLSDSLALVLHSEQYRVGIPRGLPRWDSLNQRWKEEEIFDYYLKDGWLKALREGKIERWREQEKEKILSEHKEQKSQFFRGDSDKPGGGDSGRLVSKTFYGHWHYKNHYYNKDQGLLGDAKRDTVKHCRARYLIRYTEGSNVYYSYFNQKCITDDSGYFFITINVNPSWTSCRVYPVLFPCGPDLNNPVINVSDPNITIPDYWKDPDDPTLYIMREDGTGKIRPFTPNGDTLALGWVWTDTFPLCTQPHSGCINIYETYLHARTFMEPPPTRSLRII